MATPFDSFGAHDWYEPQGTRTYLSFNDSTTINDSRNVTFGLLGVVVPASPVGVLIEAWAAGDGMALSFDGSGSLVGAAGKGDTTSTDNDTVFVTLDSTPLHGKTCDIYWCLRPTAPGRGKIYAFESSTDAFLGMAYADIPNGSAMGTQDPEGDWTGGDAYAVGEEISIRAGVNDFDFNGTMPNGAVAWDNLLPADFDSNTYEVEDELTSSDILSSTIVDSAGLGQEHDLSGAALNLVTTVSDASFSEINGLVALESVSIVSVDDSIIGQEHSLLANEILSTAQSTKPRIGQNHLVTVDSLGAQTSVESASIFVETDSGSLLLGAEVKAVLTELDVSIGHMTTSISIRSRLSKRIEGSARLQEEKIA
jgi:hypothetical protein